jgi:hypothetical protein
VESKLGPLGTSATYWPIVPAPGDCEVGEFGEMNGRGNRSTRRKSAPAPLCPLQIPLDQTRDWTRAAAVGSRRLTASAMARPMLRLVPVAYSGNLSWLRLLTIRNYEPSLRVLFIHKRGMDQRLHEKWSAGCKDKKLSVLHSISTRISL